MFQRKQMNIAFFKQEIKRYIIIIIIKQNNMDSFTLHMATPGLTRTRTETLPRDEPTWILQLTPLQAQRSKVIQHLD